MEAINIKVTIPALLQNCTQGQTEVTVPADTIKNCLDQLLNNYPLLQSHIFAVDGTQRPHVNIFYNQTNTRWLDDLNIPLHAGDCLRIIQAVSGG